MLREVEAGNVATVITKDLSRLGRNYLKTGELIEIIFPEYEVRYIAINDGVDTAREDNEFTPLRNWFNEFYARDTSKKIRAVKQAKAQRGERVNGEVPYGYIADPNDRNHLIPDPETAHVVKQIFAMYVCSALCRENHFWPGCGSCRRCKRVSAPAFRLLFGDTFCSRNLRRIATRKTGRFHQTW